MSPDSEDRPFDTGASSAHTFDDELTMLMTFALGDRPEIRDRVLSADRAAKVTEIVREDYQSEEFRQARHDLDPEVYGIADRTLWSVSFSDRTRFFLLAGRVDSTETRQAGSALFAEPDRRQIGAVLYEFDGRKTITTTHLVTLETQTFKGRRYGNPDTLLYFLRRDAGERIRVTSVVRPPRA